jgi:hypothetical protein
MCGREDALRTAVADLPELARLDATEQQELAELLAAVSTTPCARYGRLGHDIARLTDDQKRRTLILLRVLFGSSGRRT